MIYAFEDQSLDCDRRELRRSAELVPVEPQVFDLLLYLIENRDRVVSRDDLIAGVWRGRIVSESTLSSRINAARQVVGDNGEAQRLIRTVPRKGFRFVGDVREEDRTEGPNAPTAKLMAALTPVLSLPEKPSIVVLPFSNLSGDPSQEYFADGMVEDITLALGRFPWLFVIASASAFTYKGRTVDVRQVGADLGVRYVLKGSVRKDGNRVRITAQLSDATLGRQVWADRFEGEFNDIFAMQDRVAGEASTMIAPALRMAEIERTSRKPTENLTAYDLFLRASPLQRETLERNRESLRLLYRAIELDPAYAAALGLAALCQFWQKLLGWVSAADPSMHEGIRFANRAADTGQSDSEALWMAALALSFIGGEHEHARALVEKSLSLNPNSSSAWMASAIVHAFLPDADKSVDHALRALRHSPLDPLANFYASAAAFAYFWADRLEEANRAIDEALAKEPMFAPSLRLKAVLCGLSGRIDEGREHVKRLLAVNPDASIASMKEYYEAPLRHHPRGLENFLTGLRASGLPE